MSARLLLVFGFLLLSGCYGIQKYDLLKDVFKVKVHPKMTGTVIIDGPGGTKAVQITPNVKPSDFINGGSYFSYLRNTVINSNDLTFFTRVYIPREFNKLNEEQWPLFVLQDFEIGKNIFGIGFKTEVKKVLIIEGGKSGSKGEMQTYVYIDQYQASNNQLSNNEQRIDANLLKPNSWISLEVRILVPDSNKRRRRKRRSIKKPTASIYINCKKVMDDFDLQFGSFEAATSKKPLNGAAVLGMEVKKRNSDDKLVVNGDVFPGALFQTLVIDGPLAYDYYSPCHADYSLQKIPSEPLPSEYNDEKFKLYQKMSSQTVKQFRTTCEYDDPISKNRTVKKDGERWKLDVCKAVKCENGKIILLQEYSCPHCNISGKIYKQKESWIDADNVCVKKTCVKRLIEIDSKNIICSNSLVCPVRTIPPEESGECCAKCLKDTCVDGRVFRNDCDRRCGDEDDKECKEKKHGCYCPLGELLDDNGNCIKAEKCQCKSGKKVYKPGQTAKRSKCITCVCMQGRMKCNIKC